MTHRKVQASTAIIRRFGTLCIFAFGAAASPALAATGTSCDQSAESPELPEPGPDALSFEVVEHTVSGYDAPGRLSVDGSAGSGGSGLESDPGPPGVETILRRIFDETQLRAPNLGESDEPEERTAPMAIDKPESANSTSAESGEVEDAAAGPRLPGVSRDELMRFKRQMYRTDI